ETLDDETRERVFVVMRKIRSESDAALAKARELAPPYGTIAAGAAYFDEWLRGETLAYFLGQLGKCDTLISAHEVAQRFAAHAVTIHNAKRPRDVGWLRDEAMADPALHHAASRVQAAVIR